MRKIITLALVLSLGGCATAQRNWDVVTGIISNTKVSPTQILVAANAFDALQNTATQYLLFCKKNPVVSYCALKTRRLVIKDVRAGRVARDQLEPYITSGTAGPIALYNTLSATITALKTEIPAGGSQ